MGTRFIATRESMAQDAYKQMLVQSGAGDIVYTDAVSGTMANFMGPSLAHAGYTKERLASPSQTRHSFADEAKAWRDVWSAGHGVATIHDVPTVAALAERLAAEYRAACELPVSAAVAIS
jgi:nitronate monooxygenase